MGEITENPRKPDIKPELTGKEKRLKNLRPPFKKGEKPPKGVGRPTGSEDFKTKMLKAVDYIAKNSNSTPDQVWDKFYASGLTNGMKGNFPFFKEVVERLHGVVTQKTDITSNGEKINTDNKAQIDLVINNLLQKDDGQQGLPSGTNTDIKQ